MRPIQPMVMRGLQLTVAQKLLLLIAIPLLFQAGFVGAIVVAQRESEAARQASERAEAITTKTYAVLDLLVAADSDLRNALTLGSADSLTAHEDLTRQIDEAVQELGALVADAPEQLHHVTRLADQLEEKAALTATIASGAREGTLPDAVTRVRLAKNTVLTAAIQKDMVAFVQQALATTGNRQRALEQSQRQLHRLLGVGLLAVIALTAAIFLSFLRGIHARLALLTANTQRLARRQTLAHPLPGHDEFARLDRAFHAMAGALADAMQRIEEAKQAAETANRAKSEFLANMSHELRTPLNAVIGFSEILRDQAVGPTNAQQQEYLQYVLDGGRHLLSLINDILDLSKVEAGKMELQLGDMDLAATLRNSLLMVKEQAHKHGIELSLTLADDLVTIRADERKVKQIVFNLLSNAAKFTPDGGTIGLEARRNGPGEVVISIWDTGIGIEEKDRDKVFQEFRQIDSAAARKYTGTGLGLALTKRFVELHGGTIRFESAGKNQGSRFTLTLPTHAASA